MSGHEFRRWKRKWFVLACVPILGVVWDASFGRGTWAVVSAACFAVATGFAAYHAGRNDVTAKVADVLGPHPEAKRKASA